MVARGLSNQPIGKRLSIGEGTVKVHVHHIYGKLKVTSRVALFLCAREKGGGSESRDGQCLWRSRKVSPPAGTATDTPKRTLRNTLKLE
jgi:hypothetical protein